MKFRVLLAAIMLTPSLSWGASIPSPIWETKGLRTPESVLMVGDEAEGFLLVSEIDGKPAEKDGRGGIAKLSIDGKILDQDWVRGLDAPKGMATSGGKVMVADLDTLVIIDLATAKILDKIVVPDAVFLNDVTVDKDGAIYVSDTRTNKIHKIVNGKPSVYLEGLESPNGVTYQNNALYFVTADALWAAVDGEKPKKLASGFEENGDGLEMIQAQEFLVSCWAGLLYFVRDGELTELLDTRTPGLNTADIGYNADESLVYVPTFYGDSVRAYALPKFKGLMMDEHIEQP